MLYDKVKIPANMPCCICGSGKSHPLYNIRYPRLKYPGVFSLRRCDCCGLIFNSPRLPDEYFSDLYDGNYYFFSRPDAVELDRIAAVYARTISLVEDDIGKKEVLEIGSAKGYLLAVLQHLGWKVQGVEISSAGGRYAMDKFSVDTFVGTLEEYTAARDIKTYPLVLAIDLIEHVPDPSGFVACLSKTVEAGGALIIDTPNGDAHNMALSKAKWKGFNPFHIYLFSKENIISLLEKHGFVVERVFSYSNEICNNKSMPFLISRAKAVVRDTLAKLGLYDYALSFRRTKTSDSIFVSKEKLDGIARQIQSESGYLESEDSRGPLCEGCRGDNLVVIARKLNN